MSDELDSLEDHQITNTFRQEVAGMYFGSSEKRGDPEMTWRMLDTENLVSFPPDFATSADAVLIYLDKEWMWFASKREDGKHVVTIMLNRDDSITVVADTFPRAACECMIKRKRAQKGAA